MRGLVVLVVLFFSQYRGNHDQFIYGLQVPQPTVFSETMSFAMGLALKLTGLWPLPPRAGTGRCNVSQPTRFFLQTGQTGLFLGPLDRIPGPANTAHLASKS
jgi:hypothetical protein